MASALEGLMSARLALKIAAELTLIGLWQEKLLN
jgi:hypothetical protein